jgi:hypothetical protein
VIVFVLNSIGRDFQTFGGTCCLSIFPHRRPYCIICHEGRAVAQAVSRWLPTAAAWSSGICGGRSGAGADFLRVLRFHLPIFIPPNFPFSVTRGRYSRPVNGRRAEWTQFGLHPSLCEFKKYICHETTALIFITVVTSDFVTVLNSLFL